MMVVCVRYSGVLCVSLVYDLFPSYCYLFKQPMIEVRSGVFSSISLSSLQTSVGSSLGTCTSREHSR